MTTTASSPQFAPPGGFWHAPRNLRMWRVTASPANVDEQLSIAASCTDEALARVAEEGFTAILLQGNLYNLMNSSVFTELNSPHAQQRLASIQTAIDRGRKHGVDVFLYFNEPVSVPIGHAFWKTHIHLRGVEKWSSYALCTSTPEVRAFFDDAVATAMNPLKNLGGVLLITSCESQTHCWSKIRLRQGDAPPTCPRCRDREPADLVLELLDTWSKTRRQHATPFRVIAWNWEWSYWYEDPPVKIVRRLPPGIELMLDMEIGGKRSWGERRAIVGEYSLGYVGPSDRLVATQDAVAGMNVPVHAKIQLNITHEMATVPNMPVMATIHGKLAAMSTRGVAGFLACWSFGSAATMNTFALRLFMREPARFLDEQAFLEALAREYLGVEKPGDVERVVRAWRLFSEAMKHYPLGVNLIYHGPNNDAPGRVLSLKFRGEALGRTWVADPPGDDPSRCLGEWSVDEVIMWFEKARDGWAEGLREYETVLGGPMGMSHHDKNEATDPHPKPLLKKGEGTRCFEELSCARMIGVQFASIVNVFRFHRARARVTKERGLTAPCELPRDAELLAIMREEIANAEKARPLVEADARLGFHEDFQGYKYNAAMIRAKIEAMEREVAADERE